MDLVKAYTKMHSVNLHLKLSGEQQLRFLEELVSLLHHDEEGGTAGASNGNLTPEEGSPHSNCLQLRAANSESSQICSSTATQTGKCLGSEARATAPLVPHPPTSAPPTPTRHTRRAGRRTLRHTRIEVNPHLYLNEAELALLSVPSQTPDQSTSAVNNPDTWPNPSLTLSSQSNFPRTLATTEASVLDQWQTDQQLRKSGFWLRDTEAHFVQSWLRRKNREYHLKRRSDRKQRREEQKQLKERALREVEKAEEARRAYDRWLQQKRTEKTAQRPKTAAQKDPPSQTHHQLPQPVRRAATTQTVKAPKPATLHSLQSAQQQTHSTSASPASAAKRQISFEEWVQLKSRQTKQVKHRDVSNDLPEDLQAITKGMRKLQKHN